MCAVRDRVLGWVAASLAAVLAACSSDTAASVPDAEPQPSPVVSPTPSPEAGSTSPDGTGSPTAPAPASWTVGASPLPTRADGFGQVLSTPPQLVNRDLPTIDLLPPSTESEFHFEILGVDPLIRDRMGESWNPSCPVTLAQLRYVTVSFWGFDDLPHTGELIVNSLVATDVVTVFRRLYEARFPIEEMRLVTTADVRAKPTGDGNNTSAYYCRTAVGETSGFSAHAYGLAIDVNPFQNPYTRGDLVLPELASAYLDRDNVRPGMILPGELVVRAFRDIGWTWGGNFQSLKDYMHFSETGN